MKELIEKLQEAKESTGVVETDSWFVSLNKKEIDFLLSSLQSKGKTKEEVFAEEILAKYWYDTQYSLIDKTDHKAAEESRVNFRKWIENNLQSHANKDGGVTKEDFANELDKHFKNRPDLNKEFDRIDSLITSIRMCTRPIQGHNDPKSINDCFEELEYYSKLLRSRTTLPPKPQI